MKVFISHSVQDHEFCKALVKELKKRGLHTWFSSEDLKVGTPLSPQIDKGIRDADYAIVVASPNYFDSSYTRKELDTLHAEEGNGHLKVLIPIWHYIDPKTDLVDSPMLSNKWGPHSYEGIKSICDKIEHLTHGKALVPKSNLRHLWAIIFLLLFIGTIAFHILQNDCLTGYQYFIERLLSATFLSTSFALFIGKRKKKYYRSPKLYGLLFFIAFYMLDPVRYFVNKYCHNYYLKGSISELPLLISGSDMMPDISYVQTKIEQEIKYLNQKINVLLKEEQLQDSTLLSTKYYELSCFDTKEPEKLTHSFIHLSKKKILYEQELIHNEFSEILKTIEQENWNIFKNNKHEILIGFRNEQALEYYIDNTYALPDKSIIVEIRFSNPNRFFLIKQNEEAIHSYMYGLKKIERYRMEYLNGNWVFSSYTAEK